MGIRETKKDNSELFKWDGKPSAGQVFPLAAQHVLAAVVGCVTPAIWLQMRRIMREAM